MAAIGARSKSFNYRTSHFEFTVGMDAKSGDDFECLNLALRTVLRDWLTLVFWDDGAFWLDARRPAKVGWQYEFSFHGNCKGIDADVICEMIEKSLGIKDQDQMLAIWSPCKP